MVGSGLGIASAYWTSWTFDSIGNRTGQTRYSLTEGSDTTTSYTYDGAGAHQPSTLTSTTTTGATVGATSYRYDTAGNMTARNAGDGNQKLTWNDANQLVSVAGSTAGTSTFLYDADGNVLLQKDPGSTTLYLPGQQHTLNTATHAVTGVRYYPLPGATAIRTGPGTSYRFAVADRHQTPTLYLDNTAQVPTWRQFAPYGEPRGAAVSPPDNRGFLNKPLNPATGFTQIGARNYDPTIGRFVSLDPIFNTKYPQTWNGYAYANNNPNSYSDPTGNDPCPGGGGGCYYDGTTDDREQDGRTAQRKDRGCKRRCGSGWDQGGGGSGGGSNRRKWTPDTAARHLTGANYDQLPPAMQQRVDEWAFCQNNPGACEKYDCQAGSGARGSSPSPGCQDAVTDDQRTPPENAIAGGLFVLFGLLYAAIIWEMVTNPVAFVLGIVGVGGGKGKSKGGKLPQKPGCDLNKCRNGGVGRDGPNIGPTSGKPDWHDGSVSPGEGWEWRGPGLPGTPNRGAWYNPSTKESLHPDLNHPGPIGPHYDYRAPDGTFYRMYPDGRIEPK